MSRKITGLNEEIGQRERAECNEHERLSKKPRARVIRELSGLRKQFVFLEIPNQRFDYGVKELNV